MSRTRPLLSALLAAAAFSLPFRGFAQEVRRATPVGQDQDQNIPTAPAVPFEPFVSPTPHPAIPVATPVQQAPAPAFNDTVPATPPPAPANQESADQVQLDFANGFYGRGMANMAAPEYEKYLSLYPNAPALDRESALFRLGECYRKIGNVNAATNAYQTLLLDFSIGQFIGPAAYRLADMCYANKDYEGALDYFRKASIRLTDPALVLSAKFYSARCLEALNLPTDARLTYEDIVATPGDNPYRELSRLALAKILSNFGRKADAAIQFEALAREAQQPAVKVEALVRAGLLEVDLDHPAKGAAEFKKALAMPQIGALQPVAQMGLLHILYDTGKYKQLIDQYQTAFDALPAEEKPEVLILAADSKRQIGDNAGAAALYQQIIKDYPTSVYAAEASYEHLVSLYNSDDPALIPAVDLYLANTQDPSKRDQVLLLKAEALFKEHKYAEAAPVYASLENSTLPAGYHSDAVFKLGWCYMETHQPDKAISAFTDFLTNYPDNKLAPSALAQRALAHEQSGDLGAALRDFNQLLDTYPDAKERELALQKKALILGEQQDNAGMSAAFKELLKEFPHSTAAAQANYWIGSAAFSANDYKSCIEPLENARKLDKAQFFERSTVHIIAAYYNLGNRDSLASEVDLYEDNHPKDKVQVEVLEFLGKSYLDAKDYAASAKYLQQLVANNEMAVDDWLNLGRALVGAKQYDAATNALGKYISAEKDPVAQAKGLLALGRAQLGGGKLDDAQASADKACTLQPEGLDNALGRLLSGDIQIARRNYADASKIFLSIAVIIDDPQVTPEALEKAYDCLNRTGNTADAAKVLNELQSKYPEYRLGTH